MERPSLRRWILAAALPALLCPARASGAVARVSAEVQPVAAGLAAVQPFREMASAQLARLNSDLSPAALASLRQLAAPPVAGQSRVDWDRESARLIAGMIVASGAQSALESEHGRISRLLGPQNAERLASVAQNVQARASSDGALRRELKRIETVLAPGEASDPGKLAQRLESLFTGSPTAADTTWLGKIPEESKDFLGACMPPNEFRGRLFAPALKGKKGALVTVGTFRALNDAAYGDFSHAVVFDYDGLTTAFNRANVELISASRDRFEYLSRLLGRRPDEKLLNRVRRGRISMDDFLMELTSRSFPEDLDQSLPARAVRGAMLLAAASHDVDYGRWSSDLSMLATMGGSFFSSDKLFTKVQSLARRGRILCLSGDFSGPKTLRAVAKALAARRIPVSAIDLSNVHNHLDAPAWPGVVRNLSALPLHPGAVYLFTEINDDLADWTYFAVPAETLLQAARTGTAATLDAFRAFTESLRKSAPRDDELVVPRRPGR